jgi:hypothetical protein
MSKIGKAKNAIYFNFLETYFDGIFTSTNLDYTRCFQYQGVPLNQKDDDSFVFSNLKIIEALNMLEVGMVLSFVKRNRKEYRGSLEKHLSYIKEGSEFDKIKKEYIRNQHNDLRAIENFVFITQKKYPCSKFDFNRAFPLNIAKWNPFSKPNIRYGEEEHKERNAALAKTANHFFSSFKEAGIKVKELSFDEVCKYSFYHLNSKDTEINFIAPVYTAMNKGAVYSAQKTIREQVLNSEIKLKVLDEKGKAVKDCIQIGDKYISVFSLDVLGTHADISFYESLTKYLPADHEYMVNVERIENEDLYKLFKKNRANLTVFGSLEKQLLKRGEEEACEESLHSAKAILKDGYLYEKDTEGLHLSSFKFSISFTLRCDSLCELQDRIETIKKVITQQEFYNSRAVINPELIVNSFHAFLPGNSHQVFDYIYNNTLSLLYYLPIHEEYKGYDIFDDTKPSNQIYINKNNELVKYHSYYFNSNFRHHECSASTGSGKTYDFNKQIDSILSEENPATQNPVVIAIEPKRGFLKICRYHKGELISYDMTGDKSYNPFFKKRDMYARDDVNYEGFEQTTQKYDVLLLKYYVNLLEHLSKEEKHGALPPRIMKILTQCLVDIYDENDDEFIPILEDILSKIEEKLSDLPSDSENETAKDLRRIKENLSYYSLPQYKNLFSIRKELNINNDFLYFDLGKLNDDEQMKSTVMYILSSSIMRKLRERNKIKYLFLDEASVFHKSEVGAQMIDFFLRLSRSLGGVIVLGSQNVSDGIDSLASKTIKNALAVETCMYLKDGHKYLLDIGFNYKEKEIIEKLEKKPGSYVEIFRKIAGEPMVLRSVSNPFLYWLSTNDPNDDELFLSYQEKYSDLSYPELIHKLAKDYPNGHYTK